jgi:Bacterial transcriptional activator domain
LPLVVHVGQDHADEPYDGRAPARRLISLFTRSSGLVLQIFGQCGRGNAVDANTAALAASMSAPIFGKRPANWSRTSSQVAEVRLHTIEERADAMLAAGRHTELVAELAHLTTEHPLRERLHAQLMAALFLSGRRGDALTVFRHLRQRLVAELGLEPSPDLEDVHRRVLAGDLLADRPLAEAERASARATTRRRLVARQLPPPVAGFVGRRTELAWLDALRTGADRLALVVGAAGVGKASLVVHWAHAAAAHFPDGQLFLDMRAFDPRSSMSAAEAVLVGAPAEEDSQVGFVCIHGQ